MKPILDSKQLPEYRDMLIRHLAVLDVATGFTAKDHTALWNAYNNLLDTIETIIANNTIVNHPDTL